jgi:hypothetical protein
MMAKTPSLHLVTPSEHVERPAERASRLMAEVKVAAHESVEALAETMMAVIALAGEIANGGDAYPPGCRDLCRRLADEVDQRGLTLQSIMKGGSR